MDPLEEVDFELEDKQQRRIAPPEKHLQSPIVISLLNRLLDLHEKLLILSAEKRSKKKECDSQPRIESTYMRDLNNISKRDPTVSYSQLPRLAAPWLKNLVNTARPPRILTASQYPSLIQLEVDKTSRDIYEALEISSSLYAKEIKSLAHWANSNSVNNFREKELNDIQFTQLSTRTLQTFRRWRYWDKVVEEYRVTKTRNKFGHSIHLGPIEFQFYDGYIQIITGTRTLLENGKYSPPDRALMVFEQAQMFQDLQLARLNVELAFDLKLHNGTETLRSQYIRLIQWQEDCLELYGNEGYSLVKSPESIYKARLTSLSGGDCLPRTSFQRTCDKMRIKEAAMSADGNTGLTDRLEALSLECMTLNDAAELFGCIKLTGHPSVDPAQSAKSVREHASGPGRSDMYSIMGLRATFARSILVEYVRKHRSWPQFRVPPEENTDLHRLWSNHILLISERSIPLKDCYYIRFQKFMEFDYSPDYLDLLDDKAISTGAAGLSSFWIKKDTPHSRRLLEELIQMPTVDTYAIVERMRKGKFTEDERVIELTQKEREFKISARCFCKLKFEVRLFFVLTEANLKKFMGGTNGNNGYVPQQTMTLGDSNLKKRLHKITSFKPDLNTCMVEFDFERWNLKWRAHTVNPISDILEDVYGLPGVFSQAHYFFESSTVVLTDKHTAPPGSLNGDSAHKWPVSDLVWRNHQGGFEGIQQTLWTICTVTMMKWALRKEQVSFEMAGQGDNQVFLFRFSQKKNIESQIENLLSNVSFYCTRLNHIVKPEECIDSRSVLTYGKVIYVNGVHVQYSLKFSSRTFARADYSMPSLTKEIASVMANSMNVAGNLRNTFRANWWKYLQLILMLKRRLSYTLNRPEHTGIKKILSKPDALLIPGSVGGLPIIPWTRFMSRGETDDLSFDLGALKWLSGQSTTVAGWYYLLASGAFLKKKIDPANLASDPHSVPIDRPYDHTQIVADLISSGLPSRVVNRDLSQLINPILGSQGEQFKRWVTQMSPLHPVIARDLFETSPAGLYEKTIKRFTMTRTINNVVGTRDVSYIVLNAGAKILQCLFDRVKLAERETRTVDLSPYDLAQRLRTSWGINVQNNLVGVYTPFDFVLKEGDMTESAVTVTRTDSLGLLDSLGAAPPNFGTQTKVKGTDHGYKIATSNSTISALKKIVMISSELRGDQSVRQLLDNLITARCPWDLQTLENVLETSVGGVTAHRHQSHTHKFGVLGSSSAPTHLMFSSDKAGILSGGEDDYPVVFQSIFLILSNLFQILDSSALLLPRGFSLIIPPILDKVDVSQVTIPQSSISTTWPSLVGNSLAYAQKLLTYEIPGIPDASVIPEVMPIYNTFPSVCAYLRSAILPHARNAKRWESIEISKDMFDLKEVTRLDPRLVEEAIAWVLFGESWYTWMYSPTKLSIREIVTKISHPLAERWVRLRLHPKFQDSEYNKTRGIVLNPGTDGFRRPVFLMTKTLHRIFQQFCNGEIRPRSTMCILCHGWEKSIEATAKREILSLALLGRNFTHARDIADRVKRYSMSGQVSASLHLTTLTKNIGKDLQVTNINQDLDIYGFVNVDGSDILRLLRTLPSFYEHPPVVSSQLVRIRNHGYTKYLMTKMEGALPADDEPFIPISYDDRLRILSRRKAGIHTPLYSDWKALSVVFSIFFTPSRVSVFGIGRGAVVRAALEAGMSVVGFDLRDTVPRLSHRSTSYIPPEITSLSSSANFRWSTHFATTDGDLENVPADELEEKLIIDLDCSLSMLRKIILQIPCNIHRLVRFRGSTTEVRSLISLIQPSRIVCLMIAQDRRDVVCFVPAGTALGCENYENIVIQSESEISYIIEEEEFSLRLREASMSIYCEAQSMVDSDAKSWKTACKTIIDQMRFQKKTIPIKVLALL